ncbi:MAG: hypothetical protein FJ246_08160 [Nitrospira sp.]|nr:hypothetical protein [Nitrospira sp.]
MDTLTTREIVEALKSDGTPVSAKLLADYVRRGLLDPPIRMGKVDGGRGSESHWQASTLGSLKEILRLRAEGMPYRDIGDRVATRGQARKRARRLTLTVWLPEHVAAKLEDASQTAGVPVISLLQLGARLYHEAPHRDTIQDSLQLSLMAADLTDLPASEMTSLLWAEMAADYVRVSDALAHGKLPSPQIHDAYLIWRSIQDGRHSARVLMAVGIGHSDIERDGVIVGSLTTFGDRVRVFRPAESLLSDPDRCHALAADLGAVLISAEGHDFNRHGAAQALGQIADWIGKGKQHG